MMENRLLSDQQRLAHGLTISVALATYNGGRYLREQLVSIAEQTLLPAELVVSDDASDDDTLQIIQQFARTAKFPVEIRRNAAKLGFRRNFLQCASCCKSDLIAFSDQDDIWMTNKLEAQSADFADPLVMLSCHNAELIDGEGRQVNRRLDQFKTSCRLDLDKAGPLVFPRGFTQMIRKDLIKWEWLRKQSFDIGDISEHMSHDGWFFFLALLHGLAAYHEEPLVYYRQHTTNVSGPVLNNRMKFISRFANRSVTYKRLSIVWNNRCRMLQALIDADLDLDQMVKARINHSLHRYAKSAAAASHRSEYYATNGMFKKAGSFIRALMRGDFKRNDPWAFPPEGAFKDIAYIFLATRSREV